MIPFDITDPTSFMNLRILEVLRGVIDPELGINIIDMGLVYAVRTEEAGKRVLIDMTLSSPYCPMGDSILKAVGNSLEQAFEGYHAVVTLVWEPAWSYDRISEEGKKMLGA
ncbi:MAG TPA: metal-sulfur cluster assembly factor [Sphingobacteriaceae bacterium]